jgi:subtilisin family serine protease
MKKIILNILLVMALILSLSTAVLAEDQPDDPTIPSGYTIYLPFAVNSDSGYEPPIYPDLPPIVAELELDTPVELPAGSLPDSQGMRPASEYLVSFDGSTLAQMYSDGLDTVAGYDMIVANQTEILSRYGLSWDAMPTLQRVLNGVIVPADQALLDAMADDPDVLSIEPIYDFVLDTRETVPYIGATEVWDAGYTGEGVTIAIIDTGIDYTHAALGGSGDPEDYENNDPTIIEPGTFPTAKVIGGYDFVGGEWPIGDIIPDPDPLDGATHGTHVAHIAAGIGVPGTDIYPGVAPDASLYALKVCSDISSSCSGAAMLEAMEWVVDPNGDALLTDHADVVNMSIGSLYGQSWDDAMDRAVNAATIVGVLSVGSSGNSSDRPFVTGSPGTAPTEISTAQTAVPSAKQALMEITAPPAITGLYAAVWQDWSTPLEVAYPDGVEAPVIYGDGAGGNLNGCSAFTTDLSGYIVLVDRGACNFTLKIKNVGQAGGLVGIIGLVTPEDPFTGGDGGDRPIDIPGYMISQADSNTLKSGLPDTTVSFDPAVGLSLKGTVVGSSSRGPSYWMNYIKPDIAAPGASISAVTGTGTEQSAFGGTSGAAPMVTGSAALLREAFPHLKPFDIKALLVNHADTAIYNEHPFFGGDLAPITRIGGGEVRVNHSLEEPVALLDITDPHLGEAGLLFPHLSFGHVDVTDESITLVKNVDVRNFSDNEYTYNVVPEFRFADDEASGAVEIIVIPSTITLPPKDPNFGFSHTAVQVRLTIHGSELLPFSVNSGGNGACGQCLTDNEFDGYIWFDTDDEIEGDELHMAWHVLPRQSGDLTSSTHDVQITDGEGTFDLTNDGIGGGYVDAFSWIGHSPDIPESGGMGEETPIIDLKDFGVVTYPSGGGFYMAFAITTWDAYAHADVPAGFEIYLDTDQDGTDDYVVLNWDLSGPYSLGDGRNVTWVFDLETGGGNAFFFTDHAANSANFQLWIHSSQIGMDIDDLFTPMDVQVLAYDSYFTGNYTDWIDPIEILVYGERYTAVGDPVAPDDTETWTVYDWGLVDTNPDELGVLLLTNGYLGSGYFGGAPIGNESLAIAVSH